MRDPFWNGRKATDFHGYLYTVNNGTMDVEGFIDSPYGQELARRLAIRFAIEDSQDAAREYYASVGLRRECFDWEDYYTRWSLLTPLHLEEGRRYPLVFWLHGGGNSIEAEENMTGFTDIAAQEGFFLACPQNTNPEKVEELICRIAGMYPVDRQRVYLAGFSQGGAQCHGAYFRHPEHFAGVVTAGNDIWRPWDNMQVSYTPEEIARVKAYKIPLMQFAGQCEPFPYAPLNNWSPRLWMNKKPWGRPDTADCPGKDDNLDPTRIHDLSIGKFDSKVYGDASKQRWRMAKSYDPETGEDVGLWCMNRVNFRMELLDCPPRRVELCLSFDALHQDETRRVCGIYGDYEAVEYHYGYRHYTVGINDRAGREMYRFVTVQNSPHWPPLAMGQEGWRFLKRFHRDEESGKLIGEDTL